MTISPRGRHDPLGPAHSPCRRAMSGFPAPCAPDARGIPGREDAQRLQTWSPGLRRRVAAIPPAEGGRARAPGGEREAAGQAGRVVGLPERVWDCTWDIHGGARRPSAAPARHADLTDDGLACEARPTAPRFQMCCVSRLPVMGIFIICIKVQNECLFTCRSFTIGVSF